MIKTSSYHEALVEHLTDPEEAREYLRAVLLDYPEGFPKALRNVAEAHQMKRVAGAASGESLYRALSEQGNPNWETLTGVMAELGLKFSVEPVTDECPGHAAPLVEVGLQMQSESRG
jgi:probable addiction module antidote protein